MSVISMFRKKDDYEMALLLISDKGEGVKFTGGMLAFAIMTLTIAVLSLL